MIVNPEIVAMNRRHALYLATPMALAITVAGYFVAGVWGLLGLVSFAIFHRFFTARIRRRVKILEKPFPGEWSHLLKSHVAYYNLLNEEDQERFRQLLQIFLAETDVTGIGMEITELHRVLVGASAVIPIMGFPEWEYDHVTEVLLYPGRFDENYDTEGEGNILGMVSSAPSNSVVLLSAPSLVKGFANPVDKSNVGIHEFAHVIDKADGAIDGVAGTLGRNLFEPWLGLMERKMTAKIKGKPDINPYGNTNQQEFLAVTTEYFFENPKALAHKHPEVYEYLSKTYNQDPIQFFKEELHDLLTPNKVPRNARCPCGSGKKYKHCCLRK